MTQSLKERIYQWADGSPGVDFRTNSIVPKSSCDYAFDLLRFMSFVECGVPAIIPTVMGEIRFSWPRKDRVLEIDVGPQGDIDVWMWHRRTSKPFTFSTNSPNPELFADLFDWLTSE